MAFFKNTTNKSVYSVALFFCAFFLLGDSAQAATIQINASPSSLSPGGIATLSVVVNSEGVAINNAEAKIAFPADLLEVVSVSKGGSIFSLWVEEPAYSNGTGIITFNGGIPAPGFTGSSGTALSIVVKAKKPGQADVLFSDAAVRANDGLGTNVLHTKIGKTISIKEVPTSAPVPTPITLQITSPTHPSQEKWYTDNSPIFRWKVPTGVTTIQTGIDNTTSGSPRVSYSPVISEKTVPDVKDGIWYFKARARKDGEWGTTSTYIVRVDTTIPKINEVAFTYDDTKKVLTIEADIIDETSGLDYYEIYINDAFVEKVPSGGFVGGSYSLTTDTPGNNTVTLVAVDRAGNRAESSGAFKVTAAPAPILTTEKDERVMITIGSFSISVLYFSMLLLLLAILLILGAFALGRHHSTLPHKLKMRTVLCSGDNTKILLLLKKRLEKHLEALQHTRHNRVLSKEEKDIKEALEDDLDELDQAIEEQRIEVDTK